MDMKHTRHWLTMVVLLLCSITASAETVDSGTCGDNLTWTLTDEGELIIEGTGAMTDYDSSPFVHRSSIKNVTVKDGVTSIGAHAFESCTNLTSVTIPESVTSIGVQAFRGCCSLTSSTFPKGLVSIGKLACDGCSSFTVTTSPSSVMSIGEMAFKDCTGELVINCNIPSASSDGFGAFSYNDFTEITISDGVTSIGRWAFYGSNSLISIIIPKSVTEIGSEAFRDCTGELIVNCNIPSASSYNDGVFSGNDFTKVTIGNGVTSIGNYAFFECSSLTAITIPESVTKIGESAFFDCSSLTSIVIPTNVTSIGYEVFHGCSSLTSITIPENVTEIGNYAFCGCSGLTSVTIPEGVTSIGEYAFRDCSSLATISIPGSVNEIGKSAFRGCNSLTSFVIPDGVTEVGDYTFRDCTALTTITISEESKLTLIGESSFSGCSSLTSINIPDGVTSIGVYAFSGCSSLASVAIPESVTTMGLSGIFSDCSSLVSVFIPEGVSVIGYRTFDGCGSLISINIPESVTEIRSSAFEGCTGLTSITCKATVPPLCSDDTSFGSVDKSIPVYVPASSVAAYQAADGWSEFTNIRSLMASGTCGENLTWTLTDEGELIIEGTGAMTDYESDSDVPWVDYISYIKNVTIKEGVASIGARAFSAYNLTSITLPESLTSIGVQAFAACMSLTSITLPEGLTSIGILAFGYCVSLTSISIPKSVASIDDQAFAGCSSLTYITIPESVTSIGDGTFFDCSSLASIAIPEASKLTSIGAFAFYNCNSLTSINIPENVTSIGAHAFAGCSSLTFITIPESVTWIFEATFAGCSSLTSITIPESVLIFEGHVFEDCSSLTSITIPKSVQVFGDHVFEGCSSLTSMILPEYVTNIGDNAFSGCTSLTAITCKSTIPPVCISDAFYDVDKSIPVYVPAASVSAYQTAEGWKDFTNIQAIASDIVEYKNSIYFEDATAFVNTTIVLPLQLKNSDDITAVQFDVYLPDGVTIEKTSRGKYNITFNEDRADNSTHTLSSALQADGAVRVLCYSTDSELFWGNEGAIFNFPLEVSEMEEGDYSIIIKNIILTEQSGKKFEIPSMTSTLNVLAVALGDCNRDNAVDVADIVTLANHILNNPVELFVEKAADFNKDNAVDVADIVAIANFILGGNTTAARALTREVLLSRAASAEYSFDILPFVLEAEGTKTISLDLADPTESFTAFQCDLYLPEGISINKNKRGKYELSFNEERTDASYHTLSGSLQADGAVRMLCYSTDSEVFLGTEGALINIPLTADAALKSGVYEFSIANTVLTYVDGRKVEPEVYRGSIIVGDGGEVESIKLYGKYTAGVLEDFSASLSTNKSITSIDLTDAVSVAESGTLVAGNPNMLVYLSENATLANENNVVCGDECSSLQLTDGYAFDAPVAFTAQQASYTRVLTAGMYGTILLPFAPNVEEYVFCALTEANDNSLTFDEVAQPEANTVYLYTLRDGLSAAAITASNVQIESAAAVAEADGWKMIGAYVGEKIDCTTVSDTNYYVYSSENHELNRVTKMLTVKPFRAYLTSSSAINKVKVRTRGGNETVIGTREIDSMPSVYYDLSGRQVVQPIKGIYIVNGKKIVL